MSAFLFIILLFCVFFCLFVCLYRFSISSCLLVLMGKYLVKDQILCPVNVSQILLPVIYHANVSYEL